MAFDFWNEFLQKSIAHHPAERGNYDAAMEGWNGREFNKYGNFFW